MSNIQASFAIVKVNDDQYDVIITGEPAVLDAFSTTYQNVFYIEKSKFDGKPLVVVPDFPNREHADVWKQYWQVALEDPENSCDTCPAVKEFFERFWARREKYQNSKQ